MLENNSQHLCRATDGEEAKRRAEQPNGYIVEWSSSVWWPAFKMSCVVGEACAKSEVKTNAPSPRALDPGFALRAMDRTANALASAQRTRNRTSLRSRK